MILTGHSTWLKKLIKRFLSNEENNILEQRLKTDGVKLGPATVVRFQMKVSKNPCEIVPQSFSLIFGYLQSQEGLTDASNTGYFGN
jgi:hypothetical protein